MIGELFVSILKLIAVIVIPLAAFSVFVLIAAVIAGIIGGIRRLKKP